MRLGVFDIGLVLSKLGRMWTHSFAMNRLVYSARKARIRRGRCQEILFGNDKTRCRLLVLRPSLQITLSAPHDEWSDKPAVDMTVIVTWYNVECCVCELRCSAFDQECDASFEVVAADDGCRLRVLGKRNKGFNGARDVGLKAANSATIAFVGSGDYLASGTLCGAESLQFRLREEVCRYVDERGSCHPDRRERVERRGPGAHLQSRGAALSRVPQGRVVLGHRACLHDRAAGHGIDRW